MRIVAGTNRNLKWAMAKEEFRNDLYYRLNGVNVTLPPLRERRDDLSHLIVMLVERFNREHRRHEILVKDSEERLKQHSWPGNVRELENVIQQAVLLAKSDVIKPEDLEIETPSPGEKYLYLLPVPGPGVQLGRIRPHRGGTSN